MHTFATLLPGMLFRSRRSSVILLFIALLAGAGAVRALPVGGIMHHKPKVEVRAEKKAWTVAGERYKLAYGDYVRTDKGGKADVLFNNGTEIVLSSSTQIQILAPASTDQPLIIRVFGALSKILVRAKGKTEIRSAACNAAVRGTEFLINLPTEDSTTLTVVEGTVDFYNDKGLVSVGANQQSTAQLGGAPTPPMTVDATGLITWTAEVDGLPVEFETPMTSFTPEELVQRRRQEEAAIQANPDDADAHRRLAAILYDSDAYTLAVQEFDTAARLAPNSAANYTDLGTAKRACGDIPGAQEGFAHALQLAPDDPNARLAQAITWQAESEYAKAHAVLDTAPDSARINALRGLLALREGHAELAAQRLATATAQDAKLYQAHALLALTRLTLNQLPEAEAAARKAVELQPHSAQAQGTLAMVLFFANNTREATGAAELAVKINPYSPFALLTQGRLQLAQSQLDEARNSLQQAQTLAPNLPLVYTELGQVYLRLGLLPKAETAFRKALALHLVSPDAHTGLGVCLQLEGHTQDALDEHQRALAIDPKHIATRVNLAALYTEKGELAKAEETLRLGGAELPEHGLLYARLAVLSLYHQHVFEAQTYARRAVKLLPKSPVAHFVLGQVYQEQGRLTQAGQEYRLSLTLDPHYAPARYALGVVREVIETGMDLSHPLGAIDAANQGSPGQVFDLQNTQAPGFADRVQAAIEDPTVVRVASRSFGDLQVSGEWGEDKTQSAAVSYLHESDDRRGVLGVLGSRNSTNGVRINADRSDERIGLNLGEKAATNPSGWFALAQDSRIAYGGDIHATSVPADFGLRNEYELPYYLLGGNLQTSASQRTLALVALERPFDENHNIITGANINRHFISPHAEVRHDVRWGNNLLILGGSIGDRKYDLSVFMPPPLPIFPTFQYTEHTSYRWQQAYLQDTLKLAENLSVIGEVSAVMLESSDSMNMPPLPPSPATRSKTTAGLPKAIISWQPTPCDGFRVCARRLDGGIDDFQVLAPTAVFLFPANDLPALRFFGHGRSYEAEYDHTFANTSFFRLGFIHQKMCDTKNVDDELLLHSSYQAIEARFELVLTPATTGFISASVINSSGVVHFYPKDGQEEDISDLPRFKGELGLQYLNRQGWFAQTSYGYFGSRFAVRLDPALARVQFDGFGITNLRLGKRWGLHTSLFVEVDNLFDQLYTLGSTAFGGILQPRRQLHVGLTQRF